MRFDDFVLQFDTSSRGGFRARVLKSPFGEGGVGFSLPSLEPAALDPAGISRSASLDTSRDIVPQGAPPALGARPPLEIGLELYQSVFQGQVRTLLDKSRGQLEMSPGLGLRLKIKLDPSDAETSALADLPWELLCDGETEEFFALSRRTSLVRYLDVPRSSQPIPFTPPLRILAVGASPHGMQPLDLDEETRRLEELNRSSPGVDVRFLPHASAGTVREALSEDTYNVLHFMGHGTFDRASGEGMLAFEASDGSADLVSGKAFATKLRDLRSLGVVVLNACNTARAGHQGGTSPFRGVATALVLGGVPAVVAMQRPISDRAAIGFSTAFYRHLARGDSIDVALTEGRQAIHSAKPESFEWATPVLFLRMPEGNVFVAKPADSPGQIAPPVAPPPAPPPVLAPVPGPVAPKRGWVMKVVVGAAGVVLIVVISIKVIGPFGGTGTLPDKGPVTTPTPAATPSTSPGPHFKTDGDPRLTPKRDRQPDRKPEPSPPGNEPAAKPTPAMTPVPAPTPVRHDEAAEAVGSVADPASLLIQVVSTERQESSLRVTVTFQNKSDRKLALVLDQDESTFKDDKRPYQFLKSDLHLDLAPKALSRNTFDFPLPQLGSTSLRLTFVTKDGYRFSDLRLSTQN